MISLRENMPFKGLKFHTLLKKDSNYADIEQLRCFPIDLNYQKVAKDHS